MYWDLIQNLQYKMDYTALVTTSPGLFYALFFFLLRVDLDFWSRCGETCPKPRLSEHALGPLKTIRWRYWFKWKQDTHVQGA